MTQPGPVVEPATPDDVALLPDLEHAAATVTAARWRGLAVRPEVFDAVNPVETFTAAQREGRLWVVRDGAGRPIGFALASVIAGYAHLEELDVLPEHARRGVGTALVHAVCDWARDAGFPAVTLRTYADLPWNGPFYRRCGFRVVPPGALSPAHDALVAVEERLGLCTDVRVAMVRDLRVSEPWTA